jgi:hypothetical protein
MQEVEIMEQQQKPEINLPEKKEVEKKETKPPLPKKERNYNDYFE